MRIKSQRDFLAGLLFIVLGIGFALDASRDPIGSAADPGTGYLPLILASLMAVLGAIALFKSLTIETEGGDPIGPVAWRPLLSTLLAIAIFGATIDRLGLAVAAPLLVLLASYGSGGFSRRHAFIAAVVLTLAAWVASTGLTLSIPWWPASTAAA